MELGEDDEDEANNIPVETACDDQLLGDADEVVFSPCPTAATTQTTAPVASSKWGPVQAQRRSSRVDVGNRTILEIAMNAQKVQNLEADKKTIKGTILRNTSLKPMLKIAPSFYKDLFGKEDMKGLA